VRGYEEKCRSAREGQQRSEVANNGAAATVGFPSKLAQQQKQIEVLTADF
jgi:hypothetical protein